MLSEKLLQAGEIPLIMVVQEWRIWALHLIVSLCEREAQREA